MENVIFWFKKKHLEEERKIAPMDFAEFIRKLGVSENTLFSEMKGVVVLAKVDECTVPWKVD